VGGGFALALYESLRICFRIHRIRGLLKSCSDCPDDIGYVSDRPALAGYRAWPR
jgi:hypothetical protein